MVAPKWIARQLVPIIKLAQYLTEVECIEGAKMVETCISSALNVDHPLGKKLAEIDIEDLCQLFLKLHNASCGCRESYPFYLGIIRHFCQLLLSRMEEEEINTAKRGTILKVLKVFMLFGDKSLTHSLLKHLCACKENAQYFKQKLLQSFVSSSGVWGKFDPDLKLMVMNSCSALVESEIANITLTLHSKTKESANPYYSRNPPATPKSKLLNCAKFFIFVEKQRFAPEQKNAAPAFQKLFAEVPTNLLLDLALEIRLTEMKASSNIKKFPTCLEWYHDLCRRLFNKNFLSLVKPVPSYYAKYQIKSECAYKIIHCLLWLDDDESWKCFTRQICKSFPSDKSDIFVRAFLLDTEFQEAIKGSSFAYPAFSWLVDSLVTQWKSVKEPSSFTWQQPTAVLPRDRRGYEDIENFLRSTRETMGFPGFINIHEARDFARNLESLGSSSGFSVNVTASGSGRSSCCKIAKNRSYYENIVNTYETRKSELTKLVNLCRGLDGRSKDKRTLETAESNAGPSSSPAKRVKLDMPVIDLSD